MASGHVNRAQRSNTWLHRPMLHSRIKPLQTRSRPHMTQSGQALSDTAAFVVVARHVRGVGLQAKSVCFVNIYTCDCRAAHTFCSTRVTTHKIQHTTAATRQTEAR